MELSYGFLFFLIGLHSLQDWTTTRDMELQEKEQNNEKYIGKLFKKKAKIKDASFSSIEINQALLASGHGVA